MDSSLAARIEAAYSSHQAGQLAVAESGYRDLLRLYPRQVDVLYLLSSLLMAARPKESLALAEQAVTAAVGGGGIGVSAPALEASLWPMRCIPRCGSTRRSPPTSGRSESIAGSGA